MVGAADGGDVDVQPRAWLTRELGFRGWQAEAPWQEGEGGTCGRRRSCLEGAMPGSSGRGGGDVRGRQARGQRGLLVGEGHRQQGAMEEKRLWVLDMGRGRAEERAVGVVRCWTPWSWVGGAPTLWRGRA